jgi:hypothetical protein
MVHPPRQLDDLIPVVSDPMKLQIIAVVLDTEKCIRGAQVGWQRIADRMAMRLPAVT